jgi:thiol-disulfide isomerase/thioredoxin
MRAVAPHPRPLPQGGKARWKRIALELFVGVVIVAGIQAWRARDLLPADERTAAPPFQLLDLEGRPWNAAKLAGEPALIYFFAPWCGVCAASAPQLRWFHRWRGDEVQVLLVGLDYSTPAELREFAAKHGFTMPVLVGDPATAAAYRIRGYPTYYVMDAQGRIARRDVGLTTVAGLWLRTIGL